MKLGKIIIIVLVAAAIVIQFFRIDKNHPEVKPGNDYLVSTHAPQDISKILKTSCYDCHSYETVFPWYANIAPVSWLLNSHISEARENLNFSEWGDMSPEEKIAYQQGCIDMIKDGDMPLKSYTLMHKDARLNQEKMDKLINWFKQQQKIDNQPDTTQQNN